VGFEEEIQQAQQEFDQDELVSELEAALRRTQKHLRRSQVKVEALVEATQQGAYDAMLALGGVPLATKPEKDKRRGSAEVALWDMGDWQGAKVTTTYNSAVMQERVMRFCDKAAKITEIQRAAHPVRDCTIIFGGDMIEGLFNYATQPFEIDSSLFGQYVTVSRLMVDVVKYALSVYEHVTVVAEWGNHGRIGSKRAVVPRNDNVDRMCYELARQLLAGEKRLTWEDCPDDIQRLEIGNYRALVIHGDEVGRNGYASRQTITNHVVKWRSGSFRIEGEFWEFRDCYAHHHHTHAEEPLANGEGAVFWAGSTESDNRYARDNLAAAAIPSQRLHFVDPVRGRVTSQYKVYLDH
jgi:hypothetical protein